MILEKLKERWLFLLSGRADQALIKGSFEDISRRYSEPHRHYHTLEHIASCLEYFDTVRGEINRAFQVELAVWFHDVIYDPEGKDNEYLSAEYLSSIYRNLGINKETCKEIESYIMLTKHPSFPKTLDEKYLVDIDLSILGSDRGTYNKYASSIRKEYSHVPSILYNLVRTEILKRFLKGKTIYQTEYFIRNLERKARENLQWEIRNILLSSI